MKKSDIIEFERELRPILQEESDRAEVLKAMAKAARDKGIDWSQFKKLVKARIDDAKDGTDKRVASIIEKADFAAAYADMLGFASSMNKDGKSCSSENAPAPTQKPVERASAPVTIPARAPEIDLTIPPFLDRRAPQ